jgi:serine/threonine protein kinase
VADVRFYAAEVALALRHLHRLRIVSCALKMEHVMLECDGHAKLLDFGLAKHFEKEGEASETSCGTSEHMAARS